MIESLAVQQQIGIYVFLAILAAWATIGLLKAFGRMWMRRD